MGLWRCTKCGSITSAVNKPLVGTCTKGGGHRWTPFHDSTAKPQLYYCGKCGVVTSSQSKPMDGVCPKGGRHTWRKRG